MTAAPPPFRLVLAGVGGQGCVTMGRVVGRAALAAGCSARVGELHGLSQRGGSVQVNVVVGPGRTARIEPGQADAIVALEPLEALRALSFAGKGTRVLVNVARIVPFLLTFGGRPYPPAESILASLAAAAGQVTPVDATLLAHEAGAPKAANVAMLGALAATGVLPFPVEALAAEVDRTSPERWREANRRAFAAGQELGKKERVA